MSDPLLAIVGRPNVGKSTLFNRLVGGRPALVHDTPGLTRDRRYGETDYFGTVIRLVDTGGLDMDAASEVIGAGIHRQAMRAIDEADAVLLVVDGRAGLSAVDHELAAKLRTSGKKLFLAVNKIDHAVRDDLVHEFHALGLGEPFSVSAAHGRGIDGLLEAITHAIAPKPDLDEEADAEEGAASDDLFDVLADLPEPEELDENDVEARDAAERKKFADREAELAAKPLRVAFVGRPNAGKSSLTNRLLGEERSLVHDVAGTTTDPVDSPFSIGGRDYILVDTAGIRRKARIEIEIEKISVSMAIGQLERADVAVLVIDAELGPSEQDARIAGMVEQSGRALVIALNKSDRIRGDEAKAKLREQTEENFHFLTWAPTVLLSAQRGDGVDRLLDVVDKVAAQHRKRVRTAELNRFFKEVIEEMPPPLHNGRSIKINYITQATSRPPTFVLWCNNADALSPQYKRFISNRLRQTYGFDGTPIRIAAKQKKDRHKND